MQLAFARIKESWEDAYLTSLSGRPIEAVIDRIRTAEKIGLFSSDDCPPARLAQQLLERGIDYFRAYVCENLGSPDERVTQAELADLAGDGIQSAQRADSDSRAQPARPGQSGQPAPAFRQSGRRVRPVASQAGLITQAEVRAIALAQLDIRTTSVVWDIGAGSGSVAIEAAQLASSGDGLRRRARAFRHRLDSGERRDLRRSQRPAVFWGAPRGSGDALPEPEAIFVGGTGRQVDLVLTTAFARLCQGGSMAVNVVTIDGLATAYHTLKSLAGTVRVWNVSIARGIEQMDRLRFESIAPTFLLAVTKRTESDD